MTTDVTCPQCGSEFALDVEDIEESEFTCSDCDCTFLIAEELSSEIKEPYPALRLIADINKACGILILTAGIIIAFVVGGDNLAMFFGILAGSVFAGVFQFAAAESTILLIDIATNSRRTNQLLERIAHQSNRRV